MTSAAHERATDRVAEAVEQFAADIVVMVQGDEPMITPDMIQTSLEPFRSGARVAWDAGAARRATQVRSSGRALGGSARNLARRRLQN